MYVFVYVYGCLNILVFVLVYVYTCVGGYFLYCVLKVYSDTVKCCPPAPPVRPCPASVLSGKYVSGCADSTEPVACAACRSGILDMGTRQNAVSALLHTAAGARLILCCCVGVRVGMYVCGAACYTCCGVPQRLHNFGAFLKRFGSRHACKLTPNWLGAATRNRLSDDSP